MVAFSGIRKQLEEWRVKLALAIELAQGANLPTEGPEFVALLETLREARLQSEEMALRTPGSALAVYRHKGIYDPQEVELRYGQAISEFQEAERKIELLQKVAEARRVVLGLQDFLVKPAG